MPPAGRIRQNPPRFRGGYHDVMMKSEERIELHLAHSPDPDDAFMWWALTNHPETGRSPMNTGRFRFTTHLVDIETANAASETGEYDITAISCAQYAQVAERYAITAAGASTGAGYGPKLVTRGKMTLDELRASKCAIASPGLRTTANLVASMMLRADAERFQPIAFDEVIHRVESGEFEAGIVIHEGQLTFHEAGLHLVADLGAWWGAQVGLPLPLGLNVAKRDLDARFGEGTLQEVASLLRASIEFAMNHRREAVDYALRYARGIPTQVADEFVRLYVNDLTLDLGDVGRRAIDTLLGAGARAGLIPTVRPVVLAGHDQVKAM